MASPGPSGIPLAFPVRPEVPGKHNDNLPAEYSSFVGRERTLADVRALLSQERLVTLTGTGGVGKTRTAIRVAREMRCMFPDGVWFVELAPLANPSLVPHAVARVLQVQESRSRTLTEALVDGLRQRLALLILDNCEHLIDASARLADTLLKSCPQLRVLSTSRQPLGLAGEHLHRIASLAGPPAAVSRDSVLDYAAARLFVERARAAEPGFRLTRQNTPAVVQICRQLDGIPLALELAAAHVRGLSAEQLATRLWAPLQILVGGSQAAPSRQRTMRAALDWSYTLLSAAEQRLLARVVVFVGGWTIEAAEAVCAGGGIDVSEILGLLLSLVDRSLVVVVDQDRGSLTVRRYALLEPSRAYLAEKLASMGDEHFVRRRHAEWCQALTDEAVRLRRGPGPGRWLELVEPELDNLRAALDWLVETGATVEGLRLADSMSQIWLTTGYLSEGRARITRLLAEAAGPRDVVRAKALLRAAQFAEYQGDYAEEAKHANEALEIFRQVGDANGVGEALSMCGSAAFQQGKFGMGRELLNESASFARQEGNTAGVAAALMRLASILRDECDFAAARSYYEEALELRQKLGDRSGVHHVLSNLGWLSLYEGDYASASSFHEASLAIRREFNDPREIAVSMTALAKVALVMGDRVRARDLLLESLPMHERLGNRWGVALALEGFAGLAAQMHPTRALRLAGAAAAVRTSIGRPLPPAEQPIMHKWLEQARTALPAKAAAIPWSAGLELPDAEAIAEALVCPPELTPRAGPARRRRSPGGLTRREIEVAGLIARGLTNRQIGEALVIAERTAETHVERIMNKLGLHSRAEVAAWSVGHGLLA